MSTLETRKIEPLSGTTVTLGASGDAVTIPAGATLKTNTVKDAGGNTIWTSDGSGTLSSVNTSLSGGMVFISSQTASGVASVEFTSGIDSTYDEYVFYFLDVRPVTVQVKWQFQVNAVGQTGYNEAITSTFWYHAQDEGAGSAASFGPTYNASNDQAQGTGYQPIAKTIDNEADSSSVGELHIFSPSSTTYVKQFYARMHTMEDSNPLSYASMTYAAGYINTTAAIDEVSFNMSSGNIADAKIYLYGIK